MMSASNWIISVCLITCFLKGSVSEGEKTVESGDDVTLQCEGPRDADTVMFRWNRSDLNSDYYVFYFRDNHIQKDFQHKSFYGRVELMDPQMKDGNFSVILKNVNIKDNGTYECYVGNKGNRPQLITNITLTVRASEITVKPEDNVSLQCQGPRDADIDNVTLKWIRPDLKSEGFVFYFRDNRIYEDFQHECFRGRVELMDQKMKQGNFSVILKNVTIKDTGTYECYVSYGGEPELINTIKTLTVRASGGAAEHKKEEEPDGNNTGHVGLTVGLSVVGVIVVVIVVIVVGFLIYRKHTRQTDCVLYQAPAERVVLQD